MKNKNFNIIFGTGTPRAGGSLVSNLLSARKDFVITTDMIHFFRFIFKKYYPLTYLNKNILIEEFCLRIKFRFKIILNKKKLLKNVDKCKNYDDIFMLIFNEIKFLTKKNNVGEYANSEWRNISTFLKMNKSFKAFQVLRDPRASLVSFKNITFEKNLGYLNILIDWYDSVKYLEKNLKKFGHKRFLILKFEDIHNYPLKTSRKLCKFLNIKLDKRMFETSKWPKYLNSKFCLKNSSAYTKKKVYGFSKKRTLNWIRDIEQWELALTQNLLGKYLRRFKYKIFKTKKEDLLLAKKIISKNKSLNEKILNLKRENLINHKKPRDASDPKNWSATNIIKHPNKMFIDTPDYKKYIKELILIHKKYQIKDNV